jgi:5-(carboxyamino)imidazole ribonucleotide mutase
MKKPKSQKPLIGIIMGSSSDAPPLEPARDVLSKFGVPFEFKVVSAHRTPDDMFRYAEEAQGRGIEVIIAAAGGAAHLPGMVASKTTLPVIGVPIKSKMLKGIDSLLSIAQMPAGVPVATVAINGATNAALLALRILSIKYPVIAKKLDRYRLEMKKKVLRSKV